MTSTTIPHLCGGILFGLLLQARKQRSNSRKSYSNDADGLADTNLLGDLIKVITGDNTKYKGRSFDKATSNYKTCSSSKGTYIPFTDPTIQAAFDIQYKKNYSDLLKRMSEFIETYLSKEKCKWLVCAIIDTMHQEGLNIEIAINYTDSLKACDLHNAKSIIFLPFLLSVLHYVVMKCPDCESGKTTFEDWYEQSKPRAPWVFKSNIGSGIEPIDISFDYPVPNQTPPLSGPSSSDNHHEPNTQNDTQVLTENQATSDLSGFAPNKEEFETAEKLSFNKDKNIKDNPEKDYYNIFKSESDDILKYCIKMDPSAEPISIYLPDEIDALISKWDLDIRKVHNRNKRKLVRDVLETLNDYNYYISYEFMRATRDGGRLIFRNSSIEEGNRLRDEMQPNLLRLRRKLADLYVKLWPAPELDSDSDDNEPLDDPDSNEKTTGKKTVTIIRQQTNVVQNGDNNINLVVNGTLNLEL